MTQNGILCEAVKAYDGDHGQYNLAENGFRYLDVETLGKDYLLKALTFAAGQAMFLALDETFNFEETPLAERLAQAEKKVAGYYEVFGQL